jgi:hypothetical protein
MRRARPKTVCARGADLAASHGRLTGSLDSAGDAVPDKLIATRRLVASRPGGQEFTVTLGIGAPIALGDGTWSCFVELEGLFPGRDVHGPDSWQALMRAQNLARQLLEYFVGGGGGLKDPDTNKPLDVARLLGELSPQIKLMGEI